MNMFDKNLKDYSKGIKTCETLSSSSFSQLYFNTYNLIKNSDKTFFSPEILHKHQYFGAFINKSLDLSIQNSIIKLGIPKLLEINKDEEHSKEIIESAFSYYLENFKEENQILSVETHTNCKYKTDFKNLFVEDIFTNTYQKKNSIPNLILKNESQKMIYYSNINEENLIFNPFKLINYEIELQKSFNNLVYKIKQPIDVSNIYVFLIYMLQGIPSRLFVYDEKLLKFEMIDKTIRLIGCTSEITKNFLDYFSQYGSKIFLIQNIIDYYLYDESTTYVIKNFYFQVNSLILKINEKFTYIKNEWTNSKTSLVSLFNKVETFQSIIDAIYNIFNLPIAVENFLKNDISIRNMIFFREYYKGYNIKSHNLLNSLFDFYNSYKLKTKNFSLIKNLLVNTIRCYFFYILKLIFNNEIFDNKNEFFMIKNKNIGLDPSKLPKFLYDYRNILLNNSILINYIQLYDEKFFSVCNHQLKELYDFIENLNFQDDMNSTILREFINLKNSIFDKKLELMFSMNESLINIKYIERTDESLKRINNIKSLKKKILKENQAELNERLNIKEKKREYLNELKQQLKDKQDKISKEIEKAKIDNINFINRQKQDKEIKDIFLKNLKEVYINVLDQNKYIILYNNEFNIWRHKRRINNDKRYELFNNMFDEIKINEVYQEFKVKKNYHYYIDEEFMDISEIPLLDTPQLISKDISMIIENTDIHNYILNDIIIPIINDTVKIIPEIIPKKKIPKFFNKNDIQSEVFEVINQIQNIINDNNIYENLHIEIPVNIFLEEIFFDIIIKQHKIVNNCFVFMMKNKFNIIHIIKFLNEIYLCKSGDIISNISDQIFDFRSLCIISNEDEFLNDILQNELNKKYKYNIDYLSFIKNVKFVKNKNSIRCSIDNIENAFKLCFEFNEPISFFFNRKCNEMYDIIFKYNLKLLIFHKIISKISWFVRNERKNDFKNFRKFSNLFFNLYNLLNSFLSYYFFEIIDNKFKELVNNISNSVDVYFMMDSHFIFLNMIIELYDSILFKLINKLFINLSKLYMIILQNGEIGDMSNPEFTKIINKLSDSKDKISYLLSQENIIGVFNNFKYYIK